MKFVDWYYRVDALFEISDEELNILLELATNSEDPEMEAAAQPDGFIRQWKQLSDMKNLAKCGTVRFTATISQLNKTTELLETDYNAESAKLHLQFQEILSNWTTEQDRVMPRALD